MRTGITCKKIPYYYATQLAGGLLLKKLKYFEVMLNILAGVKKMQNLDWSMQISLFELLNLISQLT